MYINEKGGGIMKEYIEKLKEDGMVLKKIPKARQTAEMCRVAINQNPKALRMASQMCVDYEMCLSAVKRDANVYRYVPAKFKTQEISNVAFEKDVQLISKIPEKFRTKEMYIKAISTDVSLFEQVPEEERLALFSNGIPSSLIMKLIKYKKRWIIYMPPCDEVLNLWISFMKEDFYVSDLMPDEVKKNNRILEFQRSLGKVEIIDKYYCSEDQLFYVDIKIIDDNLDLKYRDYIYKTKVDFITFYDFYSFLNGDLHDAKLIDYDFKDIDLSKYNIEGAVINSDILIKQGLYNGEYYDSLRKDIGISDNSEAFKREIAKETDYCFLRPIEDAGYDIYDAQHFPFFYISDIHLVHRVINKFKYHATEGEVKLYIKELVLKMVNSIGTIPLNSFLLIAGDTSSNFDLSKMFYDELAKLWNPRMIVVVSGNHELWNPNIDLDQNISTYRQYFNEKGITYLQNDIFYIEFRKRMGVIKEEELLSLSDEEIRDLLTSTSVIILGGIGFSGLNEKYNALNMRYGISFESTTKEEAKEKDIQESSKFNFIYEKLLKSIPKNKVIVLTHMKKDDWNAGAYNSNWIYVNGHTHRNFSEVNEKRVIYADNQIGYRNESIGLKYFYMSNEYDVFAYVEDGIHEITMNQYKDFNRGKQIDMSFNRESGTIYMLKKNDSYLFLIYCYYNKSSKKEKLYLLNGGTLRGIDRNRLKDLEYYYSQLNNYTSNVNMLLDRYTGYQKKISGFIKSIGGSGKIHGCIVDVDKPYEPWDYSYCHIYVNPNDGKVTPYFAYDIRSRLIYKDLKTMLESHSNCKLLVDNYLRLERESKSNLPVLRYSEQLDSWEEDGAIEDESSDLYKVSRIIKSLQYCTEKNVVRIWNESLLDEELVSGIRQANSINGMVEDKLIMETVK